MRVARNLSIHCPSQKILCKSSKLVVKEVRSFLSKLRVTNLGCFNQFDQFDIKVLKQVALVDSMRSSSESFQVV